LGTALTDDFPTEASQEPHASCDAAFSCLLQLSVQSGADLGFGRGDCRNVVDGDTLSISRLLEVAGELGFKAQHARLDWPDLQKVGFGNPILVLLKNTNVILVTGGGRDGAQEVAVWDPADRYGKLLFVPREEFERASTGRAVIITPPPSNGAGAPPSLDLCWYTSAGLELLRKTSPKGKDLPLAPQPLKEAGSQPRPGIAPLRLDRSAARGMRDKPPPVGKDFEKDQLPPAITDVAPPPSPASSYAPVARRAVPRRRFWLAAAGIVVAAGIGVVLQSNPAADRVAAGIGVIREFSEIALGKALSIAKATVRDAGSDAARDPQAEPVPSLRAPSAAPATEPSAAAAPTDEFNASRARARNRAAVVSEPGLAAPPAAPVSEPALPASSAASAGAPSLAIPSTAPASEPSVAAARSTAPASELSVAAAPPAASATEPSVAAAPRDEFTGSRARARNRAAPVNEPALAAPPAAPVSEPLLAAPPAASASAPPLAAPSAASASAPPFAAPSAASASAPSLPALSAASASESPLAAPPAAPVNASSLAVPPAVVVATTASDGEGTARPKAPADFRLSAEESATLLARGDKLLSTGDVTSARLFYQRAADGGAGLAAIRLGETYDPIFLDRAKLRGVRADLGAALSWYRRARELGATDAEVLLKALETK